MKKSMRLIVAFGVVAMMLGGCALQGAGGGMGGMTADQINAVASNKSSSAGCTKYTGAGGQFVAAFTNTDKGTVNTAGGDVDITCGDINFKFKDNGRSYAPPKEIPITGSPPLVTK